MAVASENLVEICNILVDAGADVNKALFGLVSI